MCVASEKGALHHGYTLDAATPDFVYPETSDLAQ